MEDWYKILGVRPTASAAEIKRAYRAKAKKLHPDTSKDDSTSESFRILARAYEVLSDSRQRSLFDTSFSFKTRYEAGQQSENTFDYRIWLLNRTDFESRSKLVFWDLLHNREDDAVKEYKSLTASNIEFSLSRFFTRENFMDYGFILAEELVLRGEYYEAAILLEQIIKMEYSYSYFRHFFPEVISLARNILSRHLEFSCSDDLALDAWERALELGFSNSDDACFLSKMAGTYMRIGDPKTAEICLNEARRLYRNVSIPDNCRNLVII